MTTSNDFDFGFNDSNFTTSYEHVELDFHFESDVNNDLINGQPNVQL